MRIAVASLFAAASLAVSAFAAGCAGDPGCKPGNEKIDGVCRLPCTTQDGCPAPMACVSASGRTFCAENSPAAAAGPVLGGSCRAILKLELEHPDCDARLGCFAQTPGDGEAYCTRFDCKADAECGAGFYCATVNKAPNATTYTRTFGETRKVCAKRSTFCAPCSADVDCASRGYHGPQLRCVAGAAGTKFCTSECATDGNCAREAACKEISGVKVCAPIFGACTGAGSLCDRCTSDASCKQGAFCIDQEYTKERSCSAVPEGGVCAAGKCGTPPAGAPWAMGCAKASNGLAPTDQCVGLRDFGTDRNGAPKPYLGCWAANAPEK